MQNLIQLEDDVKGLPDQALQQLAKAPNPQVPQFLVISEIQRRGDMRKRFEARQQQQPQGTVAQQIVNPQPQGIASMMPQQGMPQGGPMPMPQGGPMPQPPMGQPMPQAPMQQPMPQPMAPQGMATGGVIRMAEGRMATFPIDQTPAQSSIIGQRINNPYNIRQYDQGFLGESGEDSGFISFEDPMYGVRAADRVLTTYGTNRGINTIRGLINRFAPPSENDTSSYVNYISGQLGIDPDAEVDLSDPEMRARILSPMAMMESRSEYSPGQITGMIEQANLRQGETGATQFPTPTPNIQMPMPAGPDMDAPRERATKTTTEFLPVPPQTPSELMTGIFGGRQTPEVGEIIRQSRVSTLPELENALPLVARQPTRKQAEAGDVIRMAENTKVDPKGLITTDNNPVSAIIEDAAKGETEVQQALSGRSGVGMGGVGGDMKQILAEQQAALQERQAPVMSQVPSQAIPPTTDISGSLDILRQSREAIGDPGSAVTDRLNYLMGGAKNLESRTDEISGLGLPEYGTREYNRQVADMVKDFQVEPDTAEGDKPMSDAQKALMYGGNPYGGMIIARQEEEARTQRPEGTFAEERLSKEAQINMRAIEAIQTKQAELQEYIATHDTTDPAVKKEVRRRESQLSELNTRLSQFNQPEKKGGSDATVVDTDAAEQAKPTTEAAAVATPDSSEETSQQVADRYIQEARAAREAGLMSKEELAKKEALGAALIQLGAGIAKGDLAEGLSKAGVAAQDVREKARDRALRAKYYDSLSNRSSNLSLEQKRVVETAKERISGMKGSDGALLTPFHPEYEARLSKLITDLGNDIGIDMSAAAAIPEDPTASAVGAATASPATSRYVIN